MPALLFCDGSSSDSSFLTAVSYCILRPLHYYVRLARDSLQHVQKRMLPARVPATVPSANRADCEGGAAVLSPSMSAALNNYSLGHCPNSPSWEDP